MVYSKVCLNECLLISPINMSTAMKDIKEAQVVLCPPGVDSHMHVCSFHRVLLKVYYVPSTVVLDAGEYRDEFPVLKEFTLSSGGETDK